MIKLRAAVRRWYWLLVTGAVVGAVVGGASATVASERPPSYDATSVVLFDLSRASIQAQEAAAQAGLRVTRGAVPLRAAQILGANDTEPLLAATSVEVDGSSLSLTIRSTASSPTRARAVADAFTTAFLETSNQQELEALDRQIGLVERQLQAAERRLAEFDQANPGIAALTDPGIPLVGERSDLLNSVAELTQELDDTQQRRDTTTGPYSRLGEPAVREGSGGMLRLPTSVPARVGLLALLGLGLGGVLMLLVERANPRIDTKDEALETLGVPVLALVPRLGRRARRASEQVAPEHFGGAYAESYRRLRSAIQFVSGQPLPGASDEAVDASMPQRARSFLVVSPSPSEGKTSTVAYTAFALAEADIPALALNADCRRPTLHSRLGIRPEPGLTDLAELRMDRPSVDDVAQRGPIGDLYVVPSGRPGPLTAELVAAAAEVIDAGTARGAVVLVDSSPLLATADALELVPLVDHVVMVIRNGRTTRREALEGLELLRQRDVRLLGCVCIGAPESRRRYSSYYENDYHYSAVDRPAPPADPPPGPPEPPSWQPNPPAPPSAALPEEADDGDDDAAPGPASTSTTGATSDATVPDDEASRV